MPAASVKWQVQRGPINTNEVLVGDGFYISFNPNPGLAFMGRMALGSDDGGPETALCHIRDHKFYVLNGDFRKAYERLVPQGWEACKRFYDQQSAHSSWSSHDTP